MRLPHRRFFKVAIILSFATLFALAYQISQLRLENSQKWAGWFLIALVFFLMLMNVVRKLPFYKLTAARPWSQIHIYIGLFTFIIFLFHTEWQLPRGWLETTLMLLFYALGLSGILGWIIFRTVPPRLAQRGEEILYERIPFFRQQINDDVAALLAKATEETGSTLVSDFYFKHLHDFFSRRTNFFLHLFEHNPHRVKLTAKIKQKSRLLSETDKQYFDELKRLLAKKDDLDYHFALKTLLKRWLFFHIPLAYSLLVFTLVHILAATSFSGIIM